MRRQRIIASLALLLLAVAVLLCLRPWHISLPRDNPTKPEDAPLAGAEIQKERDQDTTPPSAQQQSTKSPLLNIPENIKRAADSQAAVARKNVPIDFWGKVVDQDDSPLGDVKVKIGIRNWQSGLAQGFQGHFTPKLCVTAGDGTFEVRNESGDVLAVEAIEKEGYEADPSALRNFGYNTSANISPSPSNPIILRMWKAGIKSELVQQRKHFWLVPDGRQYTVNLIDGTALESSTAEGDFRVRVKRPADAKFGEKFDWSCTIEAISGGIMEERDPKASMYLAPNDGYTREFALNVQATQSGWSPSFRKRFFLVARDTRLRARFTVHLSSLYSPDKPEGSISIEYALNQTGSRVLR